MDETRVEMLCNLLRGGLRLGRSLQIAGIPDRTHREWMTKGAGEELPEYVQYRDRVHAAMAAPVVKLTGEFWKLLEFLEDVDVDKGGKNISPELRAKLVMWGLERMGGLTQRVESEVQASVQAEVTSTVAVSRVQGALTPEAVAAMTPEQVAASLGALAAKDAEEDAGSDEGG